MINPIKATILSFLNTNRLCKRFFSIPIPSNSGFQSFVRNIKFCRPIKNTFFGSTKVEVSSVAPISCLLNQSNPTTVFLAVISFTVRSINLCLRLTKFRNVFNIAFVHIIFKFLKRIPKTFDSFRPIFFKSTKIFIFASCKYPIKDFVKSGLPKTVLISRGICTFSKFIITVSTSCAPLFNDLLTAVSTNSSKFLHVFLPQKAGRFASILPSVAAKLLMKKILPHPLMNFN